MKPDQNAENASFAPNQRFALADNLDNIDKIKRMWRAQWPEFSWLTVPGVDSSRCYQMFAPDILRAGYGDPVPAHNNQCPVWSIMCPQQGVWIETIKGTLNIEVTVTGTGGWLTEDPMVIDAQITIQPKIWFSPSTMDDNPLIKLLWELFKLSGKPFPYSKANAIKLNAYGVNKKDQPLPTPVLDITTGMDGNYKVPPFAMHNTPDIYNQVAASVANVAVEIGEVIPTGDTTVDWFNKLIMDVFNLASGNLLAYKNVLSWNVWVIAPEEVYTPEWQMHADYWRFSLDVNHRSPQGNGRNPAYFDGKPFNPELAAICNKLQDLKNEIKGWGWDAAVTAAIEAELSTIIANNCGSGTSGKVVFE